MKRSVGFPTLYIMSEAPHIGREARREISAKLLAFIAAEKAWLEPDEDFFERVMRQLEQREPDPSM